MKKNEESLLYLNAIDEYVRINDPQEQYQKAQKIVDTFVRISSRHELNVDNYSRDAVIQRITPNTKLTRQVFDPITKIIMRELKEDAFPRYIRTTNFKCFVILKGEDFIRSIALDLRVAGIRNAVLFQPKDFSSDCITDRDIQFIMKLNQDTSDWEAIIEKIDRQAYMSKTNYSIGGMKGLRLGKIVGTLPYHIDQVMQVEFDSQFRQEFDPHVREMLGTKVVKAGDGNNNPYTVTIFRYTMSLGPTFQRRVFDMINVYGYDTERQCFFAIGKTSDIIADTLPPSEKKKFVHAQMIYGYNYYKISDNKTRYVHVYYNDVKLPLINDIIFAEAVKQRSKYHHEGYLKLLKKGIKAPEDTPQQAVWNDFKERYLVNGKVKTWDIS
jgi:hypothetical protein